MPTDKLERILWIPDCHIPYHDKRAFRLMIKAARQFKPHNIIILGDFADFYAVSDHDKDPKRLAETNFQDEVDAVNFHLDEVDSLGAKSKTFIAGNHSQRLERYVNRYCPTIAGAAVKTIQDLFGLKRRGWEYIPYRDHKITGPLYSTHDVGVAGRYAAFKAVDAFQDNVVTGHNHRMAYLVESNAKGKAHVSATFGWLGSKEAGDSYMRLAAMTRNWVLGFGVGYLDKKTNLIYVQPIPIINYTCCIEGKII